MVSRIAHSLTVLAAVFLLAAVSFSSAARMGPAPDEAATVLDYWTVAGLDAADVCGDLDPRGEGHHCPLCRLLADPPGVSIAPRMVRLSLTPAWQSGLGDQTPGAQFDCSSVSPRGPPAAV